MKAHKKWRGLLNVSGFHVDPGYNGRLIFAVFNAGPADVHLRRGEECFLVWFSDLDRPSEMIKRKPGFDHIPADLVNNIAGEFKTVSGLSKAVHDVRLELSITQSTVVVILALMVAIAVRTFWPTTALQNSSAPAASIVSPSASSIAPPTAAGTPNTRKSVK